MVKGPGESIPALESASVTPVIPGPRTFRTQSVIQFMAGLLVLLPLWLLLPYQQIQTGDMLLALKFGQVIEGRQEVPASSPFMSGAQAGDGLFTAEPWLVSRLLWASFSQAGWAGFHGLLALGAAVALILLFVWLRQLALPATIRFSILLVVVGGWHLSPPLALPSVVLLLGLLLGLGPSSLPGWLRGLAAGLSVLLWPHASGSVVLGSLLLVMGLLPAGLRFQSRMQVWLFVAGLVGALVALALKRGELLPGWPPSPGSLVWVGMLGLFLVVSPPRGWSRLLLLGLVLGSVFGLLPMAVTLTWLIPLMASRIIQISGRWAEPSPVALEDRRSWAATSLGLGFSMVLVALSSRHHGPSPGIGLKPGAFPEQAATLMARDSQGGDCLVSSVDAGYMVWRLWPDWTFRIAEGKAPDGESARALLQEVRAVHLRWDHPWSPPMGRALWTIRKEAGTTQAATAIASMRRPVPAYLDDLGWIAIRPEALRHQEQAPFRILVPTIPWPELVAHLSLEQWQHLGSDIRSLTLDQPDGLAVNLLLEQFQRSAPAEARIE